ncbi:hypothetical protein ACFWA1_36010 [Streptomyces sp. NPDC060005]|uniref:hypothetical protein n=1 Tax=Streptomyces sp. NPDC060005 TaxID=3347034 RepID=UPI003698DC2E
MTLHRAVRCDTDGCLALFVVPPQLGPDAAVYAARRAGWNVTTSGITARCPACRAGTPVLERGDCPYCCGRTHHISGGERCEYCGHVESYPDDDGAELVDDVEDQEQHEHGQDDVEQLLAAARAEGGVRP